jgi:tetratricopeptide (TPR) repeat protein
MIQEVLYRNLNMRKRRILHERIGSVLEELYRDGMDEGASELAFHFSNTKEFGKAYEYSWRAGEKAASIYSFEEAVHDYEIALRALRRMTEISPTATSTDVESQKQDPGEGNEKEPISMTKGGGIELNKKLTEVYDRLGCAWEILGNWDQSIEYYSIALDLLVDRHRRAEMAAKIGKMYRKKGMLDEAIELCENALNEIEYKCKERCSLLNCIGAVFYNRGDLDGALGQFKESLEIVERIGDDEIKANVYNNMGVIHFDKCEYDIALDYYEKNRAIREKTGDKIGLAQCYHNIGNLYIRIGKYKDALEIFEKSYEIKKGIGDQVSVGDIYHSIGVVHYSQRNYEEALEYFSKCVIVKQKMGDISRMSIVWGGIGLTYLNKESYEEAEKYLRKSMEGCEKFGDNSTLSYCLAGLAVCALRKDHDVEKAMELCIRALRLSRDIGLRGVEGWNQEILGMIYSEMKNWSLAEKSFEDSIKIYEEIEEPTFYGDVYFEYARMWKDKGDIEKARNYFELALCIFKEKDFENEIKKLKKELAELEK